MFFVVLFRSRGRKKQQKKKQEISFSYLALVYAYFNQRTSTPSFNLYNLYVKYNRLVDIVDPRRVAITLVYYGLTINATDIAGDKYLNFVLVSLVEIPSCVLYWMIMEGMSRKMSLSCMFVFCGATSVAYNLTPDSEYNHIRTLTMLLNCIPRSRNCNKHLCTHKHTGRLICHRPDDYLYTNE